MNPYIIKSPKGNQIPILVSVPHCGTAFPENIIEHYEPSLIQPPDDTDFFVHQLYDFVVDMGITMIHAEYSRWVIDLNRSPNNEALYKDGRLLTGLTPTNNFLGTPIYKSSEWIPTEEEVIDRKELYFRPYYEKITEILEGYVNTYGIAILWDAHSIRRSVPTIQKDPFPDMIVGTNDGKAANVSIIQMVLSGLSESEYEVSYNQPFKGGNITRYFGNPQKEIHAIQLEMCKNLYMDDEEINYHTQRAQKIQRVLKNTFEGLMAMCANIIP